MPNYVIKTTDGTLLPTSEAAAQAVGLRGALGLGTLATQNGTFSGTSSGTNTGDQTITLTGDATGTGTGSFAVVVRKVNGVDFAAIGDGILKIVSGQVSVAAPSSFPTLNQDTTGTAANVPATGITGDTLPNSISKSSLTTLGTITLGQWQSSTPVAIAYGGTGATNATNAFTALQPQNLFPAGSPSFAGLTLTGTFDVGGHVSIEATQGNISTDGTISATGAVSTKAKLITISNDGTPTNTTANDSGITIPSSAGSKTLTWNNTNQAWTSNQNFSISTGKTYKINGTDILSATTLGSTVINSSLTSVGTIGTGYWNSNIGIPGTIGVNYVTAAQVIAAVNSGGGSGTLDADLTAIAAIGDLDIGYLKKTAANSWSVDGTTFIAEGDPRLSDARPPTAHTHPNATTSVNGFMSATDKVKLDGYPELPLSFDNAALTGIPTAPTPDPTDVSTQIATTAFVEGFVSDVEDGIYTSLDDILFNNIIDESGAAIAIDDAAYLYKYVRLTNTGSITITLSTILPAVLGIGTFITFRRTTLAGAITLTPGIGVTINDVDTSSVLGGDTFMIKYLGADTWDFI